MVQPLLGSRIIAEPSEVRINAINKVVHKGCAPAGPVWQWNVLAWCHRRDCRAADLHATRAVAISNKE